MVPAIPATSDGRAERKIIYKRQNSAASRAAATICGKLLGREGNLLAGNSADILRGIFAPRARLGECSANVISRPAGVEGVIYEHETAESKRKGDRERSWKRRVARNIETSRGNSCDYRRNGP